jgi:hypothetical protein
LFVEAAGEAFACFLDTSVSFQDLSSRKAPSFFVGLVGLSYFTTSIKISWIMFIGILFFLGFSTTFSSLVYILRYLHSHHFLILAPSVECDPSYGYLIKEKLSLQLKLGLQGTHSSLGNIKSGLFSFQARLVRTNKLTSWP